MPIYCGVVVAGWLIGVASGNATRGLDIGILVAVAAPGAIAA
jgi:hypothetical protein